MAGAVIGALAGYIFFTERGRAIRYSIEPALEDLFARAARNELRAHIGATYGLEDAAQAQTDLVERRTTGKVLLEP